MSQPRDVQGGAICIGSEHGGTPTATPCYKAAAVQLHPGDPVKLDSTVGSADGYPRVTRAAATEAIYGYVAGIISFDDASTKRRYMASADTGYVAVTTDRRAEYLMAEDGDTTPLVATTAVGKYIDLATVGNGSTATGRSSVELDSTTVSASDGQMYIVRKYDAPDNDTGYPGCRWVVRIHEPQATE